jgi:hypothetical protein
MLIPNIPLEIKVEQPNHTYITYTAVNDVIDLTARAKAQAIINSPIRVSKITIKLG